VQRHEETGNTGRIVILDDADHDAWADVLPRVHWSARCQTGDGRGREAGTAQQHPPRDPGAHAAPSGITTSA
jgi:hypothetical protein